MATTTMEADCITGSHEQYQESLGVAKAFLAREGGLARWGAEEVAAAAGAIAAKGAAAVPARVVAHLKKLAQLRSKVQIFYAVNGAAADKCADMAPLTDALKSCLAAFEKLTLTSDEDEGADVAAAADAADFDLQLAIRMAFMDLQAIKKRVSKAWLDARAEKVGLLEASAMTSAAVRAVQRIFGRLETRDASLAQVETLSETLKEMGFVDEAENSPSSPEAKEMDAYFMISLALLSFRSRAKANKNEFVMACDENYIHKNFGPRYNEELYSMKHALRMFGNEPKKQLPVMSFLMYQLHPLYNRWLVQDKAGQAKSLPSFKRDPFFAMLDEYFSSGKISFPLVFGAWCWVESLKQVEGQRRVARISAYVRGEARRMRERLAKQPGAAPNGDKVKVVDDGDMSSYRETFEGDAIGDSYVFSKSYWHSAKELADFTGQLNAGFSLYRYNPWMAGVLIQEMGERFLNLGLQVVQKTMRLKSVVHLYNTLVLCGQMENGKSRLLEQVIASVGESNVFPTGRPTKVADCAAAFVKSCLGDCNFSDPHFLETLKSVLGAKHFAALEKILAAETSNATKKEITSEDLLWQLSSSSCPKKAPLEMLDVVQGISDISDRVAKEARGSRSLSLDGAAVHVLCTTILREIVSTMKLEKDLQALVSAAGAAKDSGKKEEQTLRALCVCTAFKFIFEASEGQEFASLKPVAEAIKKQVDEAGEFLDIKEQHNSTVAEEFVNQIDRVGAKRDALGLYLLLTPPLYFLTKKKDYTVWEFGRVLKGAKKTNMSAKEKALLEQALKNPNGMRQIKQIVERNPDILRQKGRGLVHRLAATGPPSLLDWIVQKGGAPVASAACFAAASGNVNTFAVLYCEDPRVVHTKDPKGNTPIQIAAKTGNKALTHFLRMHGHHVPVLAPKKNVAADQEKATAKSSAKPQEAQ